MPRFLVLVGLGVEILVPLLELGILVKLFIFKDFVVFVVAVRTGLHGVPSSGYSAGGFAAAGAGVAAAPG
ncbi:MAG TPA: hypothetical protein VL914_07075 [Vicinamibacterales bacterium]|nr:hypothetical protein [Vicinamibacterales bacterium]